MDSVDRLNLQGISPTVALVRPPGSPVRPPVRPPWSPVRPPWSPGWCSEATVEYSGGAVVSPWMYRQCSGVTVESQWGTVESQWGYSGDWDTRTRTTGTTQGSHHPHHPIHRVPPPRTRTTTEGSSPHTGTLATLPRSKMSKIEKLTPLGCSEKPLSTYIRHCQTCLA